MEFYVKRDETTYYYKLIGHNGNTVFYKEVEKGIYKGSSEKKAITKNGKEYYYEMYQYNQGTCVKNAMRSSPIK